MIEENLPSPADGKNRGPSLDDLVRLLEEDRIGYRLERFVSAARETLISELTDKEFSVAPQPGMAYKDLFNRVEAYDVIVSQFVLFFAVGVAYCEPSRGSIWADFIERIAICNQYAKNGSNDVLRKMSLYPALPLLYAVGILAAAREQWHGVAAILDRIVFLEYGEGKPFVLSIDSFRIVPEEAQKAIPGRERNYTPLLDHIYDILKPFLLTYFVDEDQYSRAYTYFELVLATAFAHAERAREIARFGKQSEDIRVPVGRYWWQQRRDASTADLLIREVTVKQKSWPPIVAGLYAGNVETFVELATKVKAFSGRYGWG